MRAPASLLRLVIGCAGLAACAPLAPVATPDGAGTAYQAGRELHLARQYADARAQYAAALRIDAAHVDAKNGLAVLHAEQGDYAQAIAIWRELTAPLTLAGGPATAYLFSNLGHAYLRSGEFAQAVPALEKACLLDPFSSNAWQLLGQALAQLGQDERAAQMLRQAASLREHDLRADLARSGRRSTVAAIEQAARARPSSPGNEQGWAQLQLHVGVDGLMELRRTEPDAPALAQHAVLPAPVRLEIHNGNGVTGMARAVSRSLDVQEWQVARLANVRGFDVRRTRIEYQAAQHEMARQLAQQLGNEQISLVSRERAAGLTLVLGRDWRRALPGFAPAFAQRRACGERQELKRRFSACAGARTSRQSTG